MRNPLGIILILAGFVLLVMGFSASDSFSSRVSKFFTGNPTDRSVWMMIGGVVAIGVGSALSWRNSQI